MWPAGLTGMLKIRRHSPGAPQTVLTVVAPTLVLERFLHSYQGAPRVGNPPSHDEHSRQLIHNGAFQYVNLLRRSVAEEPLSLSQSMRCLGERRVSMLRDVSRSAILTLFQRTCLLMLYGRSVFASSGASASDSTGRDLTRAPEDVQPPSSASPRAAPAAAKSGACGYQKTTPAGKTHCWFLCKLVVDSIQCPAPLSVGHNSYTGAL